jgi:glutaredoxin-like protein NrdH
MVKEFLSRAGHTFVTKDIEQDTTAYDELVKLGFMVIPVTLVNGQAIKGFDEKALRQALAAAAEP